MVPLKRISGVFLSRLLSGLSQAEVDGCNVLETDYTGFSSFIYQLFQILQTAKEYDLIPFVILLNVTKKEFLLFDSKIKKPISP